MGFQDGYLNDPYKVIQRSEIVRVPDGSGGFIPVPVVNVYPENRPDSRSRQVLQLGARHFVEKAEGALDAVLRLSRDDFGVFARTLQVEWRQEFGEALVVPFLRYHRQDEADFFVQSLDDLPIGTPSADPDGSGPNYSADYRLSSLDAISGGVRVSCPVGEHITLSAAYERYVMGGAGGADGRSQDQAYPAADIWTFGLSARF